MSLRYYTSEFWNRFTEVNTDLELALQSNDTNEVERLLQPLKSMVHAISSSVLDVEYDGDFFELTFDGGFSKSSQYINALLKKSAPSSLVDQWMIHAFRQPLSARAYATTFSHGDATYQGSDIYIYYTIDRGQKCLHLQVYCEGFIGMDEQLKLDNFMYMLQLYVGQIELEAHIGSIEFLEDKIVWDDVCLLPNFYEDIIDVVSNEQWVEYQDPTMIYSVFQRSSEEQSIGVRKDMKFIFTTHPFLQEELLNDQKDICEDMISKGGEYGYFYYEPSHSGEDVALVRQQLERELHELFYEKAVARVIGGAIGSEYCYIDMLVFDLELFAIICDKLKEHLDIELSYVPFVKA